LPIFADFFPRTVETKIANADTNHLKLVRALPQNGMSGIVLHKYKKGTKAITGYIRQTASDGSISLLNYEAVPHENLPTIKTPIQRGDRVIGGYLYQNVLLLAPDAKTYANITRQYNKNWIHPDLYAVFLSNQGEAVPTRENLAAFAKAHQVGLVYIVRKQSAVLLDPVSQKIVAKKSMESTSSKAMFPFFSHFDEIESGWFSSKETGNYYQTMGNL
jgi:hypothetical protein